MFGLCGIGLRWDELETGPLHGPVNDELHKYRARGNGSPNGLGAQVCSVLEQRTPSRAQLALDAVPFGLDAREPFPESIDPLVLGAGDDQLRNSLVRAAPRIEQLPVLLVKSRP